MQHLTCCLQVCHVSHTKYTPFASKLINFNTLSVVAIYILAHIYDSDSIISNGIIALLLLTILCQWHFILNVVQEMATELRIRILHVKDRVSSLKKKMANNTGDD